MYLLIMVALWMLWNSAFFLIHRLRRMLQCFALCNNLLWMFRMTDSVQVSSGEAAAAQEYLMQHGLRMRRMADVFAERQAKRRKRGGAHKFPCAWLGGKLIQVA
jgi:hypothetical protein